MRLNGGIRWLCQGSRPCLARSKQRVFKWKRAFILNPTFPTDTAVLTNNLLLLAWIVPISGLIWSTEKLRWVCNAWNWQGRGRRTTTTPAEMEGGVSARGCLTVDQILFDAHHHDISQYWADAFVLNKAKRTLKSFMTRQDRSYRYLARFRRYLFQFDVSHVKVGGLKH